VTALARAREQWRSTAHYLTYRGLAAGMGHMPEPLAEGVARGVARVMAQRGSPALAMSERHMHRVLASECVEGVEPQPELVRRWSRRTFDSYARYWCDGARLPYETEAGVRSRWFLQEGHEHLRAAMALGKGIVMALPHVGSWEWGGYWLALEGMPMTAVVERLEPEELFEWFVGQREAMGLTAVPLGEGSGTALLRALKANQVAGLVSDRDMVGNGVKVEFFGETTTLPAGAATLALRTGAPLLPVVVYSGPGNWHTGIVHAPLDTARRGSLREDIARVTQDLATTFEHDIRCHPEQWHLFQPNWPSDPR
jgi:lauroyl/myristoyl acyltransferase